MAKQFICSLQPQHVSLIANANAFQYCDLNVAIGSMEISWVKEIFMCFSNQLKRRIFTFMNVMMGHLRSVLHIANNFQCDSSESPNWLYFCLYSVQHPASYHPFHPLPQSFTLQQKYAKPKPQERSKTNCIKIHPKKIPQN